MDLFELKQRFFIGRRWLRCNHFFVLLCLLLIGLLVACRSTTAEQVDLVIPTAVPATVPSAPESLPETTATTLPTPTLSPTAAPAVEETAAPTATPTTTPTAIPSPTPPSEPHYQVAFVTAGDELNVRSGPGVANEIVGELPPDAGDVRITGPGQLVAGSTWVPIAAGGGMTGWVNGRYLTETIDAELFCQDEAVLALLDELQTAVAGRDGALLAQLIHPERGLRIRRHWWNPEVRLAGDEVGPLFTSGVSHDWGIADGSGAPIKGSFSQVILPLLDLDLIAATESACDEILAGGTAGSVQLPDGYEQLNFYSFRRPGTEQFSGMDWGTWVVGVEKWQGQYYVSFLVHFEWEI